MQSANTEERERERESRKGRQREASTRCPSCQRKEVVEIHLPVAPVQRGEGRGHWGEEDQRERGSV